MKKIILSLLVYCTVTVCEEQTSSEKHTFMVPVASRTKSISVNVINDNGHTITQYNSSNLKVDTAPHIPSSLGQSGLIGRTFNAVWSHKFGMLCGIALVGYTGLLSLLLYLEHLIIQTNGWAYWRHELSLETLQGLDQQLLAKELFEDIKDRYLPSTYTALNFLDPIVCFINDCDQEMNTLERFVALRNWLGYTKLAYYVPSQDRVIIKAVDAITRLKYVKRLLVLYLSEYQIDA